MKGSDKRLGSPVTSGVNFTQNQRIEFRGYFASASLRHS